MGMRPGQRDARSLEDLQNLADVLAEKENEIEREINTKKAQHQKWNEGYVDLTRAPLTPPLDDSQYPGFRIAIPQYLPTPPSSVSEHSGDQNGDPPSPPRKVNAIDAIAVRYEAPSFDESYRMQPSFRRRIGRGGRMIIDRRGMKLQSTEGIDPIILDRFKYDRDEDEDDESPTYLIDPYDISSMRYRAAIAGNSQQHPQVQAARRAQIEATAGSTSQASPPTLSSSAAGRNAHS
jgi:enhancer of polycomb-like protein